MHFATLVAAASASFFLQGVVASPVNSPEVSTQLSRRGFALKRDDLPDEPEEEEDPPEDFYLKDDDSHQVSTELEKVFHVIESIPDDVLESGDDETDHWMVEHGYRPPHEKRDVLGRDLEERGVAGCAFQISKFILTNAIPAAKILRVKRYIRALGGVRRAARLLVKTRSRAEMLRVGGKALWRLFKVISGFGKVQDACS